MKHFLRELRNNWVIIAFLASVIVAFTSMQNKVGYQEKAQACMLTEISAVKNTCGNQNTDIAVIKNDISTMKENMQNQGHKMDKILAYIVRAK